MIQSKQKLLGLTLPVLLALWPAAALAEPEPAQREGNAPIQPQQLDSVAQRPLFDDWAPRRWLEAHGVVIAAHEIGEFAANSAGTQSRGSNYNNHADLSARIDLRKAGAPIGGTVRIGISDRFGSLNSNRFGAYFQTQGFYGQGQNLRFDELSYETPLPGGRVTLKAGFYAMGNDYAGLPYTCNFTTNALCGHPLSLLYGSGWVDSPTGQWGARLRWQATPEVFVQLGAYDVNPHRKQAGGGFSFGFAGTTGVIVPLEIDYVTGHKPSDYPGTLKFGVYYDSSRANDLADPSQRVRGRGGLYLQGAKQVWKVDPDDVRGLSLFGVATLNENRTGLFRTYYELGASFRGPFRGRGDDIVSLGWVTANINPRLRRSQRLAGQEEQTHEQIIEFNYTTQALPWLIVRPAIQYSIRPGGYDSRPDPLVFTLHVQATL